MHWIISLVKSRSRQMDVKRANRGSGLAGVALPISTNNACANRARRQARRSNGTDLFYGP